MALGLVGIGWMLVGGELALGPANAGRPTKSQLLDLIRACEASCRTIEFEGSYRKFDHDSDGNRLPFKNGEQQRVKVRLETPPGKRYYVEAEGTIPLHSPQAELVKFSPRKFADAFNGQVGTQANWGLDSEGGWRPATGYVNRKRNVGNKFATAMFPFLNFLTVCYDGEGLSSYLASREEWEVASQNGPVVTIRVGHPRSLEDEIFRLDLSRGASILSVTGVSGYGTKTPVVNSEVVFELEQDGDHWVPRSMRKRNYAYSKSSGRMVLREEHDAAYSAFHYNRPLSNDAFSVAFPPGMLVGDRVIGKNYVVASTGKERERFLDRAIEGILESSGRMAATSQPESENAASKMSVQTRRITGGLQAARSPETWTMWLWLGLAATLVAVLVGVAVKARRRSQSS